MVTPCKTWILTGGCRRRDPDKYFGKFLYFNNLYLIIGHPAKTLQNVSSRFFNEISEAIKHAGRSSENRIILGFLLFFFYQHFKAGVTTRKIWGNKPAPDNPNPCKLPPQTKPNNPTQFVCCVTRSGKHIR